jgi:hypothetical protein
MEGGMSRFRDLEEVTAISHLSVTASWHGLHGSDESATAIYNPPAGWVIVDNRVEIESSNNGSRAVSTLAAGLNLATEDQFERVYNAAIKATGNAGDKKGAADLQEELKQRVAELHKYSTNQNTIQATVRASTQGSVADRKRGWEEISVFARILYIGAPSDAALGAEIADAYGVHA